MLRDSPHALLATSGRAVGLPDGQMGNSEVGHTNIGAGRLVLQDLVRVDDAVRDGSLAKRPALQALMEAARKATGTVHLMGLMSPGGVHSHQDHMSALARIFAQAGLRVSVHAFLDGRDTPPQSALGYVAAFERSIADLAKVRIARVATAKCARRYTFSRRLEMHHLEVPLQAPRSAHARSTPMRTSRTQRSLRRPSRNPAPMPSTTSRPTADRRRRRTSPASCGRI
jgi:bisphosphoglycerate-independent phosphoglycerate mutase